MQEDDDIWWDSTFSTPPLYSALEKGDHQLFEQLLATATPEEVNANFKIPGSSQTEKLIHLAVRKRHCWAFKALSEKKADFSAHNSEGYTPLHTSVIAGDIATTTALLAFANVHDVSSIGGYTALHLAASHGNVEMAELILSKAPDVDILTNQQKTPLHCAAENGHINMVNYLIEKKSNVELFDKKGYTPFHAAAARGHKSVVEFFLSTGKFAVDSVDANGNTALAVAVLENASDDIFRYLVNRGAKIQYAEKNGKTALGTAVFLNKISLCQLWIMHTDNYGIKEKLNLSHPEKDGSTLLHIAASQSWSYLTQLLLNHGADIHALDKDGRTPLAVALQKTNPPSYHYEVIKFLETALKESEAGKYSTKVEITPLTLNDTLKTPQNNQLQPVVSSSNVEAQSSMAQTENTSLNQPSNLPQILPRPSSPSIEPSPDSNQTLRFDFFNPSLWFFLSLLMMGIGLGAQGLLGFNEAVFSIVGSITLIALPLLLLASIGSAIRYGYIIRDKNLSQETPSLTRKAVLGIGIILSLMLLSGIILALSIGGLPSELPVLKPLLEFFGQFLQTGLQLLGLNSEMVVVGSSFNTGLTVGLIAIIPLVLTLIMVERLLTAYFFSDPEETLKEAVQLKPEEEKEDQTQDQPVIPFDSLVNNKDVSPQNQKEAQNLTSYSEWLKAEREREESEKLAECLANLEKMEEEAKKIAEKLPKPGDKLTVKLDWEGAIQDDLTIEKGETLTLIKMKDALWFEVRNANGTVGHVPSGALEGLPKGYNLMPNKPSSNAAATIDLKKETTLAKGNEVIAVQDWKAAQDGDLTISKGEILVVINHWDPGYPKVQNAEKKEGYVPINMVTLEGPSTTLHPK